MPARKEGKLLFGKIKMPSLRPTKWVTAGLLAFFVLSISLVPFSVAYADPQNVDDPAGLGWNCTQDANIFSGSTVTCHDPAEGSNRIRSMQCNTALPVIFAGVPLNSAYLNVPGTVLGSCTVCASDTGTITNPQTQCTQGNRLVGTGLGYRIDTANLDPVTGLPTGEVTQGENRNAVTDTFSFLGNLTLQVIATIVWFITQMLVWIALLFLSIVGMFFNFVTTEFVIQMGKYITAPNAQAVRDAWSMIRDLANIAILGGLIAMAIGTIIGSEKYSVEKNLARLLIAALLVNFSYFFAGALIDFSNYTARAAYVSVICPPARDHCGIASRIAEVTDLDQISDFGNKVAEASNPSVGIARQITNTVALGSDARNQLRATAVPSANAAYNVMLLIFICITTFVFLSAISLLIGRFVVLIFLLITSPVGIAGGTIPLLDQYSKEWWKAFSNQIMFAPVFFLLAGIALNILDAFKDALLHPAANGLLDAFTNSDVAPSFQTIMGIVAMFVIAIGFMWVALSTAKKMSADGAERFQDIYKATGAAFGWMPKAYSGALTAAGAFGLRNTLGRAGEYLGLRYGELAARNEFGKRDIKIPFTNIKIPGSKLAVGALDRFAQGRLDKARDAKYLKGPSFDEERKKREARETELDDLHKDQANKKKALNPAAMKEFAKKKKELEAEEAAGTISGERLAELKSMRDFEARSAKELALREKRRDLEARRKRGALGTAGLKELDDTKRELDELRRLKDKFGIGGAIGKHERAQERHREVYNDGVTRDYIDENEAFKEIDDKIKAGAKDLTPEQELRLAKLSADKAKATAEGEDALNRWLASADGQDHEKLSKGITSGEREAHADFASRVNGINVAEEADLAARKARLGTDKEQPDDLATIASLERRKKKLQTNALENDGMFRHRQITRSDGKGKKYILEYEEVDDGAGGKIKKPKWVEEADADYFERLDLDNSGPGAIGARAARTEGEEIAANFTKNFWEREYRKDHNSIIQYAPLMAKKKLLEIAQNHNIRESVREAMLTKVGAPWTQMIIDVEDRVRTGQLTRGSPEYQKSILVPYNFQGNNLKDHELVAEMLMSDATAGESHLDINGVPLPDGKTRKIRFRDMWGETYRKSFWQGSLSGTFKHMKDNKILGDTAMRDARSAKGLPFDVERDQWTGTAELEGYGGTSPDRQEFTPIEGGTVQLDTPVRLNNWIKDALKQTEGTKERPGVIPQYLADMASKGSSSIPEAEFRAAVETNRWAKMLAKGEAGSPLARTVQAARNLTALDPTRRAEIAEKIQSITGEPANDEQIATFNQGQVLRAQRQSVEQKLTKGTWGDPKNPDVSKMSDEDFYWYKKIKNEANVRDRYKGKTPEEVQSIFNRRSFWSPAMSIGIEAKQLVTAIEPHDPQERTAILENILKFGDIKLIQDLATNEQLRQHFDWPDEARLRKLALIRAGLGGEDLPISAILPGTES